MWVSYYAGMGQNVQRYAMPYFFLRARIQSAAGGTVRDPDGETGMAAAHRHSTMKRGQGQAEKVFVTGLI